MSDIHEILAERWSPRAFASRPVSDDQLRAMFEAARWAASCFNEQPWRYVVARRAEPERFEALLSCLGEKNRSWARSAPVLALSVAREAFSRNDRENRHALHDVGAASAQLTAQATSMGLFVHQMAGFDRDRAREVLAIPEGFTPVAAMAIGYHGDPASLPEGVTENRDERSRRPLSELAFDGRWGEPLF